MSMQILNFQRLSKLIANDIRLNFKTIKIVAATLIVLLALMPFHVTSDTSLYFLILYIGGFIISSMVFNDFHEQDRANSYLTLPCSNIERFLSKWLLTSVIYAVAVLSIYYFFGLLSIAVNAIAFKQPMYIFNILQPDLWIGIGKYVILQSIILLGAISFKKFTLIKTALVVGCLFLILISILLISAWIFCPNCFNYWPILQRLFHGGYFLFWIVLAPFCWYITYLKITEYELK